jgi:hypothetical protein
MSRGITDIEHFIAARRQYLPRNHVVLREPCADQLGRAAIRFEVSDDKSLPADATPLFRMKNVWLRGKKLSRVVTGRAAHTRVFHLRCR